MKKQELMACINGGSIIFTTAKEFLNSSITWFDDKIDTTEWTVEILRPNDTDNIMVTFVKNNEFWQKTYNTDFSETIKTEDEEAFLQELCDNADIFGERAPQRYTNL